MDQRLVAWARAVKSRRRGQCPSQRVPPLWLFTDSARLPDPVAAVARLPAGLCGVVFRHDGVAGRAALGRRLLRACRARRLWMVSAGVPVPGAGLHLRGGRGPVRQGGARCLTASAHGRAELVRARRAGAVATFLSPAFPTLSHAGAPSLGPARWAGLSRRPGSGAVLALGGIDGTTVRRLPRWAGGAAAIGALLP